MIKTIKNFDAHKYKAVWKVKRNTNGEVISAKKTNKSIIATEVRQLHDDYEATDFCYSQLEKTKFPIDLMPVEYFIGE